MNKEEIIKELEEYNEWRRGGNGEAPDPTRLGIVIEEAIKLLKTPF